MKTRKPADNRRVVSVATVAVKFRKVFEQPLDEIERVWSIRMARKLYAFKRGRSVLCFF